MLFLECKAMSNNGRQPHHTYDSLQIRFPSIVLILSNLLTIVDCSINFMNNSYRNRPPRRPQIKITATCRLTFLLRTTRNPALLACSKNTDSVFVPSVLAKSISTDVFSAMASSTSMDSGVGITSEETVSVHGIERRSGRRCWATCNLSLLCPCRSDVSCSCYVSSPSTLEIMLLKK